MEDKIKKLVEVAIQEQYITPDLAERYSERIAKVVELDKSGALRDDLDLIYIGEFSKELKLSFFEEIIRLADKTDKGEVWAIERNKSVPDPKLKEAEKDILEREFSPENYSERDIIRLWVEEAADMGECKHDEIPFYTACIKKLIAGEKERGIIRDPVALVEDGNGWFRVPLNTYAFREYKKRVDYFYAQTTRCEAKPHPALTKEAAVIDKKTKGSPVKPFSYFIKERAFEKETIEAIKYCARDKTGKNAIIVFVVATKLGIIDRPTYGAFVEVVGSIASKEMYNRYFNAVKYTTIEIEGTTAFLTNKLNELKQTK